MSFDKNNIKITLKLFSKSAVFVNLLIICFLIPYFLIPTYSIFYDIFGALLILSWIINIMLLFCIDRSIKKTSDIGKKINHLTYYYAGFFILAIILLILAVGFQNLIILGPENMLFSILIILFQGIGIIGIAILGVFLSVVTVSNLNRRGVWIYEL